MKIEHTTQNEQRALNIIKEVKAKEWLKYRLMNPGKTFKDFLSKNQKSK